MFNGDNVVQCSRKATVPINLSTPVMKFSARLCSLCVFLCKASLNLMLKTTKMTPVKPQISKFLAEKP